MKCPRCQHKNSNNCTECGRCGLEIAVQAAGKEGKFSFNLNFLSKKKKVEEDEIEEVKSNFKDIVNALNKHVKLEIENNKKLERINNFSNPFENKKPTVLPDDVAPAAIPLIDVSEVIAEVNKEVSLEEQLVSNEEVEQEVQVEVLEKLPEISEFPEFNEVMATNDLPAINELPEINDLSIFNELPEIKAEVTAEVKVESNVEVKQEEAELDSLLSMLDFGDNAAKEEPVEEISIPEPVNNIPASTPEADKTEKEPTLQELVEEEVIAETKSASTMDATFEDLLKKEALLAEIKINLDPAPELPRRKKSELELIYEKELGRELEPDELALLCGEDTATTEQLFNADNFDSLIKESAEITEIADFKEEILQAQEAVDLVQDEEEVEEEELEEEYEQDPNCYSLDDEDTDLDSLLKELESTLDNN